MTKFEIVNEVIEVIGFPAEGFSQDELRKDVEELVDICIKDGNYKCIQNFIRERKKEIA
tara:strand:+ start:51 stop:227 length:177 start_codon:yes stop_codon:yes gene_type:complete